MRCIVYGLHAGDGLIRYIGQTTWTLKRRLQQHISTAREGGDWPVARWIRKRGFSVEAVVLVPDAIWNETEVQQIARYRAEGFALLNSTDGGEGFAGYRLTAEHRAKLSASAKRRAATDEGRAHMMRATLASPAGTPSKKARRLTPDEVRERVLQYHRDHPDHHARIVAASVASKTAEQNAKISASVSALWSDPNYRANAEAKAVAAWTPERRAAQAERMRNRKHSAETVAKQKAYWTPERRAAMALLKTKTPCQ